MPTPALRLFRESCGLDVPLALECDGPDLLAPYESAEPFALVGRDGCTDLILDDPRVSRRHAFIQALAGRVFCFDLESRTRLRWNGETSSRSWGWLDPGQEIHVGPYAIRRTASAHLCVGERATEGPLRPHEVVPGQAGPMPLGGLELPIRTNRGKTPWWLKGCIGFVGRSDACQLVLSEQSVSRFHAALVRTGTGVWVVDLRAREGTLVNDTRVRWAWLDDGDTVRIGRFVFIFRYETPPDRMSRKLAPLEAGAFLGESKAKASSDHTASRRRTLAVRPKARPAPEIAPQAAFPSLPSVLVHEPEIQVASQQMVMWREQMQMMESFHNDMILMVQMIMAMHREHMTSVRGELDRISQLSQEMAELRARLAAAPDPGSPRNVTSQSSIRPLAGDEANHLGRSDPPAVEKAGAPAGTPPPTTASGPMSLGSASERRPAVPIEETRPQAIPLDFHIQLTRRVAELQRERQGYWQKILHIFTG